MKKGKRSAQFLEKKIHNKIEAIQSQMTNIANRNGSGFDSKIKPDTLLILSYTSLQQRIGNR